MFEWGLRGSEAPLHEPPHPQSAAPHPHYQPLAYVTLRSWNTVFLFDRVSSTISIGLTMSLPISNSATCVVPSPAVYSIVRKCARFLEKSVRRPAGPATA